jgi:hypothetical protein
MAMLNNQMVNINLLKKKRPDGIISKDQSQRQKMDENGTL